MYLIDILTQMHFLDDERVNDPNDQLCSLILQYKENFMVFSKSGVYTGESEDIIKNLFKVLCAIMGFKLQQRGHNQLSGQLLRTYGEAIKFIKEEPDFTTMDQIHTIKNLINRKAFTLTESQMSYIKELFEEFY